MAHSQPRPSPYTPQSAPRDGPVKVHEWDGAGYVGEGEVPYEFGYYGHAPAPIPPRSQLTQSHYTHLPPDTTSWHSPTGAPLDYDAGLASGIAHPSRLSAGSSYSSFSPADAPIFVQQHPPQHLSPPDPWQYNIQHSHDDPSYQGVPLHASAYAQPEAQQHHAQFYGSLPVPAFASATYPPYNPQAPVQSSTSLYAQPSAEPQQTQSYASSHQFGNQPVPLSISPDPISPTSSDASTSHSQRTSSASSHSPVLIAAANNRQRLGNNFDLPLVTSSASGTKRKPPKAAAAKRNIEIDFACAQCQTPIARVTLRGGGIEKDDGSIRASGVLYCLECVAAEPSKQRKATALSREGEATYGDTIAGMVDRLQGIEVAPPPPSARSSRATSLVGMGTPSRLGKRPADDDKVLECDVCHRRVGTGQVSAAAADGRPVEFAIETICVSCKDKYLRCSDCGGGGGTRGVGRWRAKELFPDGRRTCLLSHVRMGAVSDMSYDVWPITSLDPTHLQPLIDACQELYRINVLATLAVPDMMESAYPIASTYEQAMKQAVDSWTMFEPIIRRDIEPESSTRRYIALRWINNRKVKPKKDGSGPQGDLRDGPPSLSLEGRSLAGFILGEHDLLLGSLHIALTMPAGSGESFDLASRLMQSMFSHVQNDVAAINRQRQMQNIALLPVLKHAWTVHMIKKDSRMMNHIERRRGFLLLDDYLAKYPEEDPAQFAPHRPIFLPRELLKGWQVFVKRVSDHDEWLSVNSVSRAYKQPPKQRVQLPYTGHA